MCTVSAIVPVKNGEPWLRKCLDSLLEQELPVDVKLQVSIYDDGSTDATLLTVNEFEWKFILYGIDYVIGSCDVSKGAGFAKNRAVLQSSGQYLCFCDADDINDKSRIFYSYMSTLKVEYAEFTLFGSKFRRTPHGSTQRYTNWANNINGSRLFHQIFTAHGPTLVAPSWFMARELFNKVGGFCERFPEGFPEDLRFFFDAMKMGCQLHKIEKSLVTYRYHSRCTSLVVPRDSIWDMRVSFFEETVLTKWEAFTIWNAGKEGKRLFKSLKEANQRKVVAFCDVDIKKISRGKYEHFDALSRSVVATVPIIPVSFALPPVAICVKMDLTDGAFEKLLNDKSWIEGRDYYHLG